MSDQTVDGHTDGYDDGRADYFGADTSGVLGDPAWRSISTDPVLSRPPVPGSSGDVPVGDDLRLDIGWDRFEQLLVFVAQGVLGLNQVRFRRYGVSGQAQHGIDLAGRGPDGGYTVVQCKEYDTFTPADLRAAVAKFAKGKRPFGAQHLIVAVSTVARTTQLEDELADLQDKYKDLHIELWGAEQINDELRNRADIVSRFWTRETAATFCTGHRYLVWPQLHRTGSASPTRSCSARWASTVSTTNSPTPTSCVPATRRLLPTRTDSWLTGSPPMGSPGMPTSCDASNLTPWPTPTNSTPPRH